MVISAVTKNDGEDVHRKLSRGGFSGKNARFPLLVYSTLFIIEMTEKTILKRKTKQAEASTSKHTAMTKLPAIHIYKTN